MSLALPKPQKVTQDETRLDFVRQMPCLVCQNSMLPVADAVLNEHAAVCSSFWHPRGNSEAHHIRKGTQTGLRRKAPADRTVPLCSVAHKEYHAIGHKAFEEKYGLNLEAELLRINQEFAKAHPYHRARRERCRPAEPSMKFIRVVCVCGLTHDLPPAKIVRYGAGLRYLCPRLNAYESLRVCG